MKIKSLLALLFFVLLACGSATYASAQSTPNKEDKTAKTEKEDDGEDEEISPEDRKRVKITVEQARQTALARVAGTIIEEELEKENGRLVYSIEIKDKDGRVFDVEVDAETGAIFKVEREDDDDDEDEKNDDEKAKKPPQ